MERIRQATKMVCRLGLFYLLGIALNLQALVLPPVWRWSNPTPFGADVYGITYNNSVCVEVGEEGQIFISADLTNWVPCQSGTQVDLRAATYLGGRLIITGASGTVIFSDDLSTFYDENFDTPNWLESVAASSNLVVAVGDNASIYLSTNGVSWAQAGVSFGNWLNGVAVGVSNTFVTVGETGFIATSKNGYSWTVESSGTQNNLNWVGWMGDHFLAAGDGGLTLTSLNGTTWQPVTTGATNYLYTTVGTTNSEIVAGDAELRWGGTAGWNNELATSLTAPAPDWSYYTSAYTTNADNEFIVAGHSGMTAISSNDSTSAYWRTATTPVRSWLWHVTRTADHFLAVGNYGTLMSSQDGI
ncbi:MAG: hypothetical protein ABSE48_17400, partial [Verrucomicrobiota bacterium]